MITAKRRKNPPRAMVTPHVGSVTAAASAWRPRGGGWGVSPNQGVFNPAIAIASALKSPIRAPSALGMIRHDSRLASHV